MDAKERLKTNSWFQKSLRFIKLDPNDPEVIKEKERQDLDAYFKKLNKLPSELLKIKGVQYYDLESVSVREILD